MNTRFGCTSQAWCHDPAFQEGELLFHTEQLMKQVLPFWAKSFDEEYGGVYTCFSNDGTRLVSEDKYVWSQGRMLWLLGELLLMQKDKPILSPSDCTFYLRQADRLYTFLSSHALLEQDVGVSAFLLDRSGLPKEQVPGKGFYTSFYADCFMIMGYANYARLQDRYDVALAALELFDRMQVFLVRGDIRTEPYPLPEGYSTQAVPMILCNTLKVLSDCFASFDKEKQHALLLMAQEQARRILTQFYDEDRALLKEIIPVQGQEETLLGRHYNPGHAIECMWFCLDCIGDPILLERMAKVVLSSLALGWDTEYGGLFRYVDKDGLKPRGELLDTAFEHLILSSWDYKLWWPHAEALYSCLRFYRATGNREFLRWYETIKEYSFEVFPSGLGMEWTQICQRDGNPLEAVVALPVKDPYHILRMHLLSMQVLSR